MPVGCSVCSANAGEESGVIEFKSVAPKKFPVNDGEMKRVSFGLVNVGEGQQCHNTRVRV